MGDCKWMQDEICVNADCPMRADYCPVVDYPGVCRYEEREDGDATIPGEHKSTNNQEAVMC